MDNTNKDINEEFAEDTKEESAEKSEDNEEVAEDTKEELAEKTEDNFVSQESGEATLPKKRTPRKKAIWTQENEATLPPKKTIMPPNYFTPLEKKRRKSFDEPCLK